MISIANYRIENKTIATSISFETILFKLIHTGDVVTVLSIPSSH